MLEGRYLLEELIGVGGMANVYKGYDTLEQRTVAVKMLRDEYTGEEDFLRRLWGDAIRRRLGELPARGDAELERHRLSLLMRMKRIKSAPWTVAHTFMTDAL